MNVQLSLTPEQAAISIIDAKRLFLVFGRGWGKSSLFGHQMHKNIRNMPGSTSIITAKAYTHVLTSILPSAFAHLERMGYYRDIHYTIGKPPPTEWGLPYFPPVRDWNNYITFFGGKNKQGNIRRPVGFYLTSQERKGSGRGPNSDYAMTDETLRIDKKQFDSEIGPTLRANKDRFKKVPWHLGEFHSTSMPYTPESRWILDIAEYYLREFGIDIFAIWRQVVKMQIELLDITEPEEFKRHWNEIQLLKRQMPIRVSADGNLFYLGNAFDNWKNVGISYIREQRKRLPEIIFLVEIMNMLLSITDNGFYALSTDLHVYYDSWDDDFVANLAINSSYDFAQLSQRTCAMLSKKYYHQDWPIYLFFDWGGSISFTLACQFDAKNNTLYVLKEFYVMPPGEMPRRLMDEFSKFFQPHKKKELLFVRDTYGDNTSIQSSKTINQDAITVLKKNGWKVTTKKHRHKEPPMFEKWQLMQKILNESEEKYIKIRIDGNNCKYLILAMQDTKVKQVGNELHKDKTLERKTSSDQRQAPHSTDALDKGCYFLQNNKHNSIFLDVNI